MILLDNKNYIFKIVKFSTIVICITFSLLGLTPAMAHPPAHSDDGSRVLLPQGSPTQPVAGILSTPIECLSAGSSAFTGRSGSACASSGVVRLWWQGQVVRARLVVHLLEGSEPNTLTVNGKTAVTVPALSPLDSSLMEVGGRFFYLSIPPEAVMQGENQIEISGRPDPTTEAWTAINIRIQVFGEATSGPDGAPGLVPSSPHPDASSGEIDLAGGIANVVQATINFTCPYDETTQQAAIQIPDGYTGGTPTPLVIFAHPRGAPMSYGLDALGAAANAKRWLLASPEMHGTYKPPRRCYTDPESCEYFEQILVDQPGAFAYASPESQYDILGTIQYMVDHYNVKMDQIYLVGYSMGAQIGVVTAAKFPHLFAALLDNKGPTDATRWYYEQAGYYPQGEDAYQVVAMRKECSISGRAKTPAENPLCYERRSGIKFANNYIHVPISITHSYNDILVPRSHSEELRDAINSYHPDRSASIYWAPPPCGTPWHCFEPNPLAVLNWLAPFALDQTQNHIHITSDQSKAFYWLNLVQTGGAHWTKAEVTRDAGTQTVQVWAKDNNALTIGLNLGSTPMMTEVAEQPGLGLPATTYLILGAGLNKLQDYSSGYFNVVLGATPAGATFTVSALQISLAAEPAVLSVTPSAPQAAQAQIAIEAEDHLGNPAPNGTQVQLSATDGKFPNGQSSIAITTSGGRATTTLTADATTASNVQVSAQAGLVQATTGVTVLHPGLTLSATTDQTTVHGGETVVFRYEMENTGDCTLTGVRVVDDNGTPGVGGDDVTVCSGITLAAGETRVCTRSTALDQTVTSTSTASGADATGSQSEDQDVVEVTVIHPGLDVRLSADPAMLYKGGSVRYDYALTNTGDVTLTGVQVVDDNGTPGVGGDDVTVCSDITLEAGETRVYTRNTVLQETQTLTVTATGLDPLGRTVSDGDGATIQVLSPGIQLEVRADPATVYGGVPVVYEYVATNIGNAPLTTVSITDDNGTPGNSSDDIVVCTRPQLGAGATTTCTRPVTLAQTRTSASRASGRDALGKEWAATDETTVQVGMSLWLPVGMWLPAAVSNR